MANLKVLKNRIKSVKSTQKITKAMKMVSAAKLRRAREKLELSLPYFQALDEMTKNVVAACDFSEEISPELKKLLLGSGKDEKYLIIITSSDRGLCGAFNSSITRSAKKYMQELTAVGKKFELVLVGSKACTLLKATHNQYVIHHEEGITKKPITYTAAHAIVEKITDLYMNGNYDKVVIFYNEFKSAISQVVKNVQILPFDIKQDTDTQDKTTFEYEPNQTVILEKLLIKALASKIFHVLLENSTSEQGSRMTAMDNATRNAGDMISNLTLEYNRTRQALITKELIEIISGAEAI
ncbi:MAG: F0F1 ATP synthase subunit gamma [Alphaproteobacteria bacterium]|nr:F0F1 ATP synthase subunit gamma [Alphaproteobacteria bacterium]OJV15753.1 MAG: hypothetical protein BGO27_07550 [Alphaproteobacteria bacterium 33-17]